MFHIRLFIVLDYHVLTFISSLVQSIHFEKMPYKVCFLIVADFYMFCSILKITIFPFLLLSDSLSFDFHIYDS
ncbi:hypothetical protein CPJCM30710_11000 [Clostridium polyendosporum]|uniref:Uncharacterized protein n=1 Tax=Clostridium polyendosporum TaxID=69208 RepID=A0A919RY63_9CLOT|nr:hypothetical protein CPJCM30710_11000 [Clostridium polyendosporum]